MYKVSDLIPVCVLATYDHDVLYIHKDDIDKEMSVCLFMDYNSKEKEPILLMHQTQMYLTRSHIAFEIERTPENIQIYLNRLTNEYCDDYLAMTLEAFEKFREYYNSNLEKYNNSEMLEFLTSVLDERDTIYKNYLRFYDLIGRYPAEPEDKYPLTETGEYDVRNMEIIDKFYEDVKYTDEEIVFMAKYSFDIFSNKFPSLCEYYMQCLDSII
ncbi:MAG: hypothetical protein J6R25_07085 [Bacteroidales bacterium]|nr:hypothetical protein [Bacteroidales bacterium]